MGDVRALLVTDVVGSTELTERVGDDAMAEIWAAHDRVARELLPVWRGREIDKTDGMLLMFDSALDAVEYAFAYHRGLAALSTPMRARAGLHVGPVLLRENAWQRRSDNLATVSCRARALNVRHQDALCRQGRSSVGFRSAFLEWVH